MLQEGATPRPQRARSASERRRPLRSLIGWRVGDGAARHALQLAPSELSPLVSYLEDLNPFALKPVLPTSTIKIFTSGTSVDKARVTRDPSNQRPQNVPRRPERRMDALMETPVTVDGTRAGAGKLDPSRAHVTETGDLLTYFRSLCMIRGNI
jgi:hypothetical protein